MHEINDRWHINTLRGSRKGLKWEWHGDDADAAQAHFNALLDDHDCLIIELDEWLPLKPGQSMHDVVVRRQAIRSPDGDIWEAADLDLYPKTRGADAVAKLREFGLE